MPPVPDPLIGKQVDNGEFVVVDRIGSGGMGSVYKAEQPSMNRMVAIKVLHPRFVTRDDLVARFRREARAMSQLSHPNTARVYKYGALDDGSVYFVMDYLEGRNLAAEVRENGPMAPERAVRLMVQVCGALEEAHRAGIVHRDLKPENIFLTLQGGTTDFPKVLDFGLAKMSEKQMGNGSMMFTQQGMVFGTPEFMSPEQAQGDTLDNRSDIYSLALILYELITGKLPFDAKTPLDIMKAHVRDAPIPLSQRIVGKPFWPDLETVMAKALAKQPSDRYETAAQFGEALLGCLPKSAEAPATVPKRASKRPQEPAAARPNPLSVSRAAKEDDTEITRTQRASDDAPLTARPSRLPKLLLTLMSGLAAVIVAYVLVSWFRR
ncbi:MAG TPA: serine/threonine-protein kinase [Polyangiales bacterium]|nr:serine/threonine-protein kinase [Polyangiales bacterium]